MKIRAIFTLLVALTVQAKAQITDPGKTVGNAATNQANSDIRGGANSAVSKVDNGIRGLFKKKPTQPAGTTQTPSASTQGSVPATGDSAPISAYNNYDFTPGDQVVFADDFSTDASGEFPAHWNLGKGQGVMNAVGGRNALLITDGNFAHVNPLVKAPVYLKDSFTIEFDNYALPGSYGPHLYFYANGADAAQGNHDLAQVDLCHGNNWTQVAVISKPGGVELVADNPADLQGSRYSGHWHHVAIACRNKQLKVYIDQFRVLTVPNLGITPGAFDIEGIGSAKSPVILANVRIANGGGMNMLGRKFTDTKIVTHGINFDIDKATLRPESMGVLNGIADILKNNPDIRFEIDGHTDNTGAAAHNLTLSQQRADTVKQQLISMGIDASRLTTKGLGDTQPLTDNGTPEGRANNRRVEFIKQ